MDFYQELYKDMTKGGLSKTKAMSAGTLGRHTAQRNKLAESIAMSITTKYEKNVSEDKIKEIVNGLMFKLDEFNSRKETEENFGISNKDNQGERQRFLEDVFIMSMPIYQIIYLSLTRGELTALGKPMHGGSRMWHACNSQLNLYGLVSAYKGIFSHEGIDQRNFLAKNIAKKITMDLQGHNMTYFTMDQIQDGLNALGDELFPFYSRTSFITYYFNNEKLLIERVSSAIRCNSEFKNRIIYKELYSYMTKGGLSKTKAMSAGALGRHTTQRNKLAESIAMSIAKKYEPDISEGHIKEIANGLKLKLQNFNSRTETEEGFGVKWVGRYQVINEGQQSKFVDEVVVFSQHNCYLLSKYVEHNDIYLNSTMALEDVNKITECIPSKNNVTLVLKEYHKIDSDNLGLVLLSVLGESMLMKYDDIAP